MKTEEMGVCVRSRSLRFVTCSVHIEQVVNAEAWSETVSPRFKNNFKVIDGAIDVFGGGFFPEQQQFCFYFIPSCICRVLSI